MRRPLSTLLLSLGLVAGLQVGLVGPSVQAAEPAPVRTVQDTGFPTCPDPQAGVHLHAVWTDYDDATRARVLDEMVEIGMTSVRLDVSWDAIEPVRYQYDDFKLQQLRRIIGQITERGLDPLVMVWQSPDWSRSWGDLRAAPSDPAAYGEFMRLMALSFPDVQSWQVWNEPNDNNFLRGANPGVYARLLKAAYAGVKAGNPDAQVVFGGPAYQDVDWIRKVYNNGAGDSFDVMATHGYQQPEQLGPYAASEGSPYRMRSVESVRRLMVNRGDRAKPIWFTEFGWSTYADGISPQRQGWYYKDSMAMLREEFPYVERVYWYNARDRDSGNPRLDGYGLLRRDLSRKPVAWAAQKVAQTCG